MTASQTLAPGEVAAAPPVAAPLIATPMPDLFPPPRHRAPVVAFALRYPGVVIGGGALIAMILVAILAPYLGTVDPTRISALARNRPPSSQYWFGTDSLGRDVYSRVIYGARVSLTVGFTVAILSAVFGLLLGMCAGFVKWADEILMRIVDGVMTIPSILLAIALVALTEPSVLSVIIAITIVEIPRVARLMRSAVLTIRGQAYIEAATLAGAPVPVILIRHVLPNIISPLLVQLTYVCAHAMLAEAGLSFIGAGAPPSVPTWGGIMAEGRMLWQIKPYLVLIPALFLSATVLMVNVLGDGLRDALDPRAQARG